MASKEIFIRGIRDKDIVRSSFLIKYVSTATGKTGKPYLNLVLMDKTGEMEARVWDDVSKYVNVAVRDGLAWIEGTCQAYQGRPQLVIKSMTALREDEVNVADFVAEGSCDPDKLYQVILDYVASMKDPHYRALAEEILRDQPDVVDRIKRAPAAKSVHHAYRGGLIEHVVSITRTLDFMATHYQPYLDRDLLFLGGFLHDIGKLWELSYEKTTDYTMEGRLIGHLVMGTELVDQAIRNLTAKEGRLPSPFPEEKRLLVKHLILAHHGKLEYGSPKEPVCLEALVVHAIDDLDSKINSIQMFTSLDLTAGRWTALHKQFGRYFYKPDWAMEGNNR